MAKILSHVWSSASGSVGGITYFNGPHAAIIARARTNPVQSGSYYAWAARSAWAGAQGSWNGLLKPVQDAWDQLALTCTYPGKQGSYTITGRSMFMAGRALQTYINIRLLAAVAFDLTAPVIQGFLLPSNFQIGAPALPGTGIGITLDADPLNDTLVFVETSKGFGKERNFWKGPWVRTQDKAVVIPAGTNVTIDILGLTAGQKYFCRVKCVADDAPPRTAPAWYGSGNALITGP